MSYRQDKINSARELLNWLEANPEFEMPSIELSVFAANETQLRDTVKLLGDCRKFFYDDVILVKKDFDNGVLLSVCAFRKSVCERVVVGVEDVPEKIIEAQIIPAFQKEIVEWRCDPILLEQPETKSLADTVVEEIKALDPPTPYDFGGSDY